MDLWGRLSNPPQRRLPERDVDELADAYLRGSTLDELASRFAVHRTTVMRHLDRRGVARRRNVRKMTDRAVKLAAARYQGGLSLQGVAADFDVDASTLAREFRRAGIPVRPRRG